MPRETRLYLDSNAGAPLHPRVKEALLLFFSQSPFAANPSSPHSEGRFSKKLLTESREKVAKSINAPPQQVFFTSSGTEANQLAIRSILNPELKASAPAAWLLSSVEHDSTWKLARECESEGVILHWLEVTPRGLWKDAGDLKPPPALISLLWVNNESGVINPLRETTEELKARFPHASIHVDAVQAWGKIPIDVRELEGVDFLTISGHKIGAPAGIGALWARTPSRILPLLLGSQEYGTRGGTENLLGIVGLGAAAEQVNPIRWRDLLSPKHALLESLIRESLPHARILGENTPRIANTTEIIVPGIKNNDLVVALDIEGYAVSSGAACSSGIAAPSRVALAMGASTADAASVIRISLHEGISTDSIQAFVDSLKKCAETLKRG